jgi:PAS fold
MTHAPDVTRVGKQRTEARMVIDAHGQIRAANDAVHRLLNYRGDSLVGLSLAWITPPSQHTVLGELTRALHEGARRTLPGVLMRDDSSLLRVLITTNPHTGTRGRELVLSFELDDEPTSGIQSVRPRALNLPTREWSLETQPVDVPEQLAACTELLHWLESQLLHPGARESPRDRALARIALQEAAQLIELCQNALRDEKRAK